MSPTAHAPASARPAVRPRTSTPVPLRLGVILGFLALLMLCVMGSLMVGSSVIPAERVLDLLQHPDGSNDSYIVNELRVTRTVIGVLIGLALAVAGAVMQAVTRNPLADPGLLGVNAGASLAIVLGAALGDLRSAPEQFALAAAGALAAAVLVHTVGLSGSDRSPLRLVLAGVAFSAAAGGVIQAVMMLNPRAFDTFRFWDVGALTRTDVPLWVVAVPIAVGLLLVVGAARGLSDLALGDDVAAALGTNVALIRAVSLLALTLLCASATAAAGPIGFVGLMIPLMASWIMGPARGWIIALSLVAGPALILAADILGRVIARPAELQVGLLTAFVGAPVLLVMVYRLRGDAR